NFESKATQQLFTVANSQSEIRAAQLKTSADLPVFFIKPETGLASLGLKELWEYRELLYFLTWRDVKVRYKQTVLGAAWAIIQPFFMMVVFSLFFGRLARVPSDGIPYPVFAFCALFEVPRRSLHHNLSGSVLAVRESRSLSLVDSPRALANGLRFESHGRSC